MIKHLLTHDEYLISVTMNLDGIPRNSRVYEAIPLQYVGQARILSDVCHAQPLQRSVQAIPFRAVKHDLNETLVLIHALILLIVNTVSLSHQKYGGVITKTILIHH